ncbi:MAG: hypothetical protein WCZ23_04285 [Rhodospirillaceae bacterium]
MTSRKDFIDALNDITLAFPDNQSARRILTGEFELSDYHGLLLSLFHTTYEGPAISALAASHLPDGYESARQALLRNAAQAGNHWEWILDDLTRTGFEGPDPRTTFPGTEAQAYVAYNYYVAIKAPVARLGVLSVIDAIAANFGTNYSSRLFQCLSLRPEQTTFFYRRPDHAAPREHLIDVLDTVPMSDRDWQWTVNAVRTAGTLYKAIYDAR